MHGLDSSDAGYGLVVGCREHSSETSDIKLKDAELLKKDFAAAWGWLVPGV